MPTLELRRPAARTRRRPLGLARCRSHCRRDRCASPLPRMHSWPPTRRLADYPPRPCRSRVRWGRMGLFHSLRGGRPAPTYTALPLGLLRPRTATATASVGQRAGWDRCGTASTRWRNGGQRRQRATTGALAPATRRTRATVAHCQSKWGNGIPTRPRRLRRMATMARLRWSSTRRSWRHSCWGLPESDTPSTPAGQRGVSSTGRPRLPRVEQSCVCVTFFTTSVRFQHCRPSTIVYDGLTTHPRCLHCPLRRVKP